MADLPYFAADILGVTLHQTAGKLVSNEVHQFPFGSWRLELPIKVESDEVGGNEMAFWVTLAKRLNLYLVVRSKESILFVLDEDQLQECERKTRFEGVTVKQRVAEFKPAIRGLYQWKEHAGWRKVGGGGSYVID